MCLLCAAGGFATATAGGDPFPEALEAPLLEGEGLGGHLRWTGVAGLRLDRDGTAIAFDPFVSRPGLFATLFRAPRPDVEAARERFAGVDAVFVGHTHYDHAMDLGAVAQVAPLAILHGSRTTVELCRRLGIDEARLVTVEDGARYDAGPFVVEAIEARHGVVPVVRHVDRKEMPRKGLPWTPFRYPMGDVFAWRVETGGRALHVQGSAGLDDTALQRQRPADLLLACLAARQGTPDYLSRLGEVLEPRALAPLHHDDFFRPLDRTPRPVAGLDWPGFLDDAATLERAWGTRLVRLPFDRPVPF